MFVFYKRVEVEDTKHSVKQTTIQDVEIKQTQTKIPRKVFVEEALPSSDTRETGDEIIYTNEKVEKLWHEEIYFHLQEMEPHQADVLYQKYVNEVALFETGLQENLMANINLLSAMNGESGVGLETPGESPYELERSHEARVKKIFGPDYSDLKEREIFFKEDSGF